METKKNPKIDFNKFRPLLLAIGLLISTLLVSLIFEIRSSHTPDVAWDLPYPFDSYVPAIPVTKFEVPKDKNEPKPKIPKTLTLSDLPKIVFKEVVQVKPLEMVHEDFSSSSTDEMAPESYVQEFLVVEEQASFPGGMKAWRKFLEKNLKYPKQAKRLGIEGRVLLSFYVDSEGNLSDIKVIRGVGGRCDEEAIRVLTRSPKWNPGKQRGVAVKSPMTLFIYFRIQ